MFLSNYDNALLKLLRRHTAHSELSAEYDEIDVGQAKSRYRYLGPSDHLGLSYFVDKKLVFAICHTLIEWEGVVGTHDAFPPLRHF